MGALGNRATKTAKNIRRKSRRKPRRKPRKYRTPINTRKRVGGGYDGTWRHNMATLPNAHIKILAQFAANVSSLEKEYQNMSNDEREESKRIERASRRSRTSRGSINKSVDEYEEYEVEYNKYNASLERLIARRDKMTPPQIKIARDLYRQYGHAYGDTEVIEVMHGGPYERIFGRL
jgi:hypothetical protein